jgi:ABC-2 type transport system ATP-binding protein
MLALHVCVEEAGYERGKPMVSGIQFDIGPGEWVGLIGPNGAGKSTTIKAMLGMLPYRKGTVTWDGRCAYVPEQPVYDDALTLWEHLEMAMAAHDQPWDSERVKQLLSAFRMEGVAHHYPASFSKGMQQKLMLMAAFFIRPDLYIIDEPFVGLDPRAMKTFLHLLQEERERGAAVLMSTHVLDTAERVCDSFLLIDQGQMVAQGTLADLQLQCGLNDAILFDCFDRLTDVVEGSR